MPLQRYVILQIEHGSLMVAFGPGLHHGSTHITSIRGMGHLLQAAAGTPSVQRGSRAFPDSVVHSASTVQLENKVQAHGKLARQHSGMVPAQGSMGTAVVASWSPPVSIGGMCVPANCVSQG